MKNRIKVLLFVSVILNCVFFCSFLNGKETKIYTKIIKEEAPTMSEWDMFTMALMKVESEYDSTAVSSVGAKGYFQITPIYIEEVNRVHHTDYTMDDVYDLESAHEIFDLMQKAHNKNYDMDKAMVLHNGDHKWYKKRVMDAYDDIKKYEDIRNRLIKL